MEGVKQALYKMHREARTNTIKATVELPDR